MVQKTLLKVSDDKDLKQEYHSKYLSTSGFVKHGIYLRENKNTIEKLFISRGNLMAKYKYPKITPKFKSLLVNDYNLHLVGGWRWPGVIEQECVYRVLEGNKPMGFYCSFKKEERDKLVELIKDDGNWPYIVVEKKPHENTLYEVGVSALGFFEDIFDMESLLADYLSYMQKDRTTFTDDFIDFVVEHIEELTEERIEDYLYSDYANPEGAGELITTGLMLGYPIETTVSILSSE